MILRMIESGYNDFNIYKENIRQISKNTKLLYKDFKLKLRDYK